MTRHIFRKVPNCVEANQQESSPDQKLSQHHNADIMEPFEIGTIAHRKCIREDVFCYLGDLSRGNMLLDEEIHAK